MCCSCGHRRGLRRRSAPIATQTTRNLLGACAQHPRHAPHADNPSASVFRVSRPVPSLGTHSSQLAARVKARASGRRAGTALPCSGWCRRSAPAGAPCTSRRSAGSSAQPAGPRGVRGRQAGHRWDGHGTVEPQPATRSVQVASRRTREPCSSRCSCSSTPAVHVNHGVCSMHCLPDSQTCERCPHLSVTDVKIPRWLGREARHHLAHLRVLEPHIKTAGVCGAEREWACRWGPGCVRWRARRGPNQQAALLAVLLSAAAAAAAGPRASLQSCGICSRLFPVSTPAPTPDPSPPGRLRPHRRRPWPLPARHRQQRRAWPAQSGASGRTSLLPPPAPAAGSQTRTCRRGVGMGWGNRRVGCGAGQRRREGDHKLTRLRRESDLIPRLDFASGALTHQR